MERIWAPWRIGYVAGPRAQGCIFCETVAAGDDRAALVLHRAALGYLILNRYPYNSGHLMAVPYRHVARLDLLTAEEAAAVMGLTSLAVQVLERAMEPQGFNIGFNLGRAAGAGVDDHLHLHIVPRWVGDTNFMPVLGDVKVLPQHLAETYDRLAEALAATGAVPGG
ncbi:MAG: HIT domain-containing protein [Armatimonadetes bacterium]|nr:HIT domain-containing protein [Armatimonadota bacterium]